MPSTDCLAEHAEAAVADVQAGRVTLPAGLLEVGGLCSLKGRQLACRLAGGPIRRYLEVGVLHGAILCCALTGDLDYACGIDNFSQFNGQEQATRANLERFRKPGTEVRLYAGDAFTFQPEGGPFDWFSYDACHTEESTARGLTYYLPVLADPFLLLMDDFDDPGVQSGTWRGIMEAGLKVEWEQYLTTAKHSDFHGWWCGQYLAVLRRA